MRVEEGSLIFCCCCVLSIWPMGRGVQCDSQKTGALQALENSAIRAGRYLPMHSWPNPEINFYRRQGNYAPQQLEMIKEPEELTSTTHIPIAYNYHLLHGNRGRNRTIGQPYGADLQQKQYQAHVAPQLPSPAIEPADVTQHFHDIFMHYDGPADMRFGHVERRPELRAKRFEYLSSGNRHRGEMIWTDNRGAYGEHRWDMAQGKL